MDARPPSKLGVPPTEEQLLEIALPLAVQLLKTAQLAAAAQLRSATGEMPG